ncbi:MAG: RimK family alpha-L-glutamate ligase [Lachnospiraceae bacterium]|nr:RimK family alpha-L-glutamate ligase [Lachnospiraceae bacterium]
MKKRCGYLIEKYRDMGSAYTCRRLLEEAETAGLSLRMIGVEDCLIRPDGVYFGEEKLEHRDFAILRYKRGHVMEEIRSLCDFSYNSPACFDRYVDKYHQLKDIEGSGIPYPRYVLCHGASMPFAVLKEELGLPFVLKGLASSMGREIYLIEDEMGYDAALRDGACSATGPDKEALAQEFIAHSRGRDLRLYAIRGKVIGAMIRSSKDDFRSNVALGAEVKGVPITPKMEEIAKKLFICTGYDYVGIDLLFASDDPDDLLFCEMNVMAGIQGMEEATGVNVAGAIIGMIAEDFGI